MCGITGYINLKGKISQSQIETMRTSLVHSPPDGEGTYVSEDKHIALGHRRLSFLDLKYSENI